ncbi:MAG: hypothetical protein R2734_08420 [Nocardioides sp.]
MTVVGNLITGFDHNRATRVVRLSDRLRGEVHALMDYVAPTPVRTSPRGSRPWSPPTPVTSAPPPRMR